MVSASWWRNLTICLFEAIFAQTSLKWIVDGNNGGARGGSVYLSWEGNGKVSITDNVSPAQGLAAECGFEVLGRQYGHRELSSYHRRAMRGTRRPLWEMGDTNDLAFWNDVAVEALMQACDRLGREQNFYAIVVSKGRISVNFGGRVWMIVRVCTIDYAFSKPGRASSGHIAVGRDDVGDFSHLGRH